MSTGDERFLQHPGLEIPYPSAEHLTRYLDNPKVREMVRTSVSSAGRSADPVSVQGPLTVLARGLRDEERALLRSLGDRSPQVQFQQMSTAALITKASGIQGQCTVDALNGGKPLSAVTMHPYDAFALQGWIIWPGNLEPGRDVLVLRGKSDFTIELTTSADRKDVVRVMRSAPSGRRGTRRLCVGIRKRIFKRLYRLLRTPLHPDRQPVTEKAIRSTLCCHLNCFQD
jgi:hypothetical protein